MRLKDLLDLDDIPTIMRKAITIMDKEINRMARHVDEGEPLQAADAKALVNYTACLCQTSKDYRMSKKEVEAQMAGLSEEELLALAKSNPILSELELEKGQSVSKTDAELRALLKGSN